jgi:hypothetical protein
MGRRLAGVLLDVFGHARHEVLAIFVECLALLLVPVGRVDDGGLELGSHWVAGSVLEPMSAPTTGSAAPTTTYTQVRRIRAVGGNLLRAQGGGCKGAHRGAHAARRAHGVAQWPSDGLAQGHCVCVPGDEAACSCAAASGDVVVDVRSFLPAPDRRCCFWS